jgi:hypothetical protein
MNDLKILIHKHSQRKQTGTWRRGQTPEKVDLPPVIEQVVDPQLPLFEPEKPRRKRREKLVEHSKAVNTPLEELNEKTDNDARLPDGQWLQEP